MNISDIKKEVIRLENILKIEPNKESKRYIDALKNLIQIKKVQGLKPNQDYGKYRSPIKENVEKLIKLEKEYKTWNKDNIKDVPYLKIYEVKNNLKLGDDDKLLSLINNELKRRKNKWEENDRAISTGMANWKSDVKSGRLKPNKDYGKYRSPIKETNMKTYTLDRLEKMILKEEITDQKVENPIQSTGSTPEPKDVAKMGGQQPPKVEEPKSPLEQKPQENQAHEEFMTAVKPTMEKVKANQIVTWEELKKLSELFEKIGK